MVEDVQLAVEHKVPVEHFGRTGWNYSYPGRNIRSFRTKNYKRWTVLDIIKPENQVFCKTHLMTDATLSYCPGCGHGTAHNITMEVIDELGIVEDTIGVAPVGCSVLAYDFMNIDMTQAAHGRAPAVSDSYCQNAGQINMFLPIRVMEI